MDEWARQLNKTRAFAPDVDPVVIAALFGFVVLPMIAKRASETKWVYYVTAGATGVVVVTLLAMWVSRDKSVAFLLSTLVQVVMLYFKQHVETEMIALYVAVTAGVSMAMLHLKIGGDDWSAFKRMREVVYVALVVLGCACAMVFPVVVHPGQSERHARLMMAGFRAAVHFSWARANASLPQPPTVAAAATPATAAPPRPTSGGLQQYPAASEDEQRRWAQMSNVELSAHMQQMRVLMRREIRRAEKRSKSRDAPKKVI